MSTQDSPTSDDEARYRTVELTVNGERHRVRVKPNALLLNVLRDELHLTGSKYGCGTGECRACTVLLDDEPILSCLALAVSTEGKEITTVEGIAEGRELHPVQQAFVDHGAAQCGYCTPGFVVMSKHLLDENPDPTEEEVRDYLKGNICRCTGYTNIINAVMQCAERTGSGG